MYETEYSFVLRKGLFIRANSLLGGGGVDLSHIRNPTFYAKHDLTCYQRISTYTQTQTHTHTQTPLIYCIRPVKLVLTPSYSFFFILKMSFSICGVYYPVQLPPPPPLLWLSRIS